MTKDEIKEALNCCRRYDSVDCLKCPLIKNKGYGCRYNLLSYASILITKQEKEIERLKAEKKQAQVDTINTIVEYCENPNHWNELKDCKLWGGKSDDLRDFLNGIFKEIENEN